MSIPQRLAPGIDELRNFYVGKNINDVPKPAAILDVATARRHCASMLAAARALDVGFRAHIKTHKTTQLARLQVGATPDPANLVVSTLAELAHLLPLLAQYRAARRPFSVLYGVPLPPSQAARLAALARDLGGPGAVALLVDHPAQLPAVARFARLAGSPARVYLKVDTGYHRAGVPPDALNKGGLLARVVEMEGAGAAVLVGVYSHSSLSYRGTTAAQAMEALAAEIGRCVDALERHAALLGGREVVVSVGASPQVTAVENFAGRVVDGSDATEGLRRALRSVDAGVAGGSLRTKLELHAGVYAVMDMQQLATNARTSLGRVEDEVALSVVAEVVSVYNDSEREKPEALVAVGALGLGREPCPSYRGWGVVGRESYGSQKEPQSRLIVDRISQEHAIVAWEDGSLPIPLEVGQTVRIYPNHACVTGAMYGWYLVVDSDDRDEGSKIVDVWVRASGW